MDCTGQNIAHKVSKTTLLRPMWNRARAAK